jgi:hypothetical protein
MAAGGRVAAVENGGAQASNSAKWEDWEIGPDQPDICREAQECDPTWSFGKRYDNRY